MITALIVVLCVLAAFAVVGAATSIRVLREYERGVVFRLGRVMDKRGPGLVILTPPIDRMVRVSLRTVTLTVPPQEVITKDNVPARVTAVAYYKVVDPNLAVIEVEDYHSATLQIAQTTLRSVLGGKVTMVEIKDVEIPEQMQHAIARQAEAERERRAKIINAEGEAQAAAKLAEAADVIAVNPVTIQLRYLQTLREIGVNQNSTVVFPMPMELTSSLISALKPTAQTEVEAKPSTPELPAAPAPATNGKAQSALPMSSEPAD